MNAKLLFSGWVVTSALLLLYSFTQVDLNLTLSQLSIWQFIQRQFQYVGYYMRPFSTGLYLFILLVLFTLYILTLYYASKNLINRKTIWKIIIVVSTILFFSYNAFSYDLFNYIFDAKIVTYYHENPYDRKPLDFYTDPYLNFMRSTHRAYPYGPVFLALTVPLSFLGANIFLVTFYLFKLLMVGSYIGTAWIVEKLLVLLKVKTPLLGLVFFSLSPLVLIESLVSAHNDIVMVFFAIGGLYLLLRKYYIPALIFLALSIGTKFATIILLPIFISFPILQWMKLRIDTDKFLLAAAFVMTIATAAISFASGPNKNPEPQPWYLLNLIPFVALKSNVRILTSITVCLSISTLLFYLPYIYTGEWPKNIVDIKLILVFSSLIVAFLWWFLTNKHRGTS